jgi:hypothetical protein
MGGQSPTLLHKTNYLSRLDLESGKGELSYPKNHSGIVALYAVFLEKQQTTTTDERSNAVFVGNVSPKPDWIVIKRQAKNFEGDARILKMISETGAIPCA